ncbi:MAG: VOC family protein [Alphaproteobacteria bacterium]|nr:VOC family protein [Alphaproteobacteria bacterium]
MTITANGLAPLLQVYDMPAALAFYRDALGFEIVSASPEIDAPEGRFSHFVWLRQGPAHIMLNTAYDEGERPAARVEAQQRYHGDTCLYFGCEDAAGVDAVFATLSQKLPDLAAPKDAPYGMRQLYLQDPDGYGLCFQAPVSA